MYPRIRQVKTQFFLINHSQLTFDYLRVKHERTAKSLLTNSTFWPNGQIGTYEVNYSTSAQHYINCEMTDTLYEPHFCTEQINSLSKTSQQRWIVTEWDCAHHHISIMYTNGINVTMSVMGVKHDHSQPELSSMHQSPHESRTNQEQFHFFG